MAKIFENSDITLEDVIHKTRETAETIGKKSAERLEISRKRVEYFDAKAKLAKQYEKYGKLHYRMLTGEPVEDTELALTEAEIAKQLEKIDALSVEIEEAKAHFNEVVSTASQMAQKAYDEIKKAASQEVEADAVETEDSEAE